MATRAKEKDWKGMKEGGQKKAKEGVVCVSFFFSLSLSLLFFFCTHPYKATEIITDIINQLGK